ncbi:hypothetical protein [Enterococcus faecalis]|uniref:hypothetical protein n=1 Tax=Enterococcus faecalis TaxID=1351 RepID=UPI001A9723D2|nr:hypothetical protein [Enterococcus faecalis]MBO1137591.1 hypothetical protein [Enterococcus faecalis]
MILELLFNLLFGLVNFLINLIPNFDISIDLSWISGLSVVYQYLDMFVDVNIIVTIISIVLIRDNFVLLKNIFVAIIDKIPFI